MKPNNTLLFNSLKAIDTPTICNALEHIDPTRRRYGFTTQNMLCFRPEMEPIVGFARTATIRSINPSPYTAEQIKDQRVEYYRYIQEGSHPRICVMQDLDGVGAGNGAFWGQFNSTIHKALGCLGVVTDGAVRDMGHIPQDFQLLFRGMRPSHGFVHVVDYGKQVTIFSMAVNHGDIVHADIHGAVTYPFELAPEIIKQAEVFVESERPVIEAAEKQGITFDELMNVYRGR